METITLTTDEMNQILSYLGKRPYEEVVGLMNMVHLIYEKQKKENDDNPFLKTVEGSENAR